MHRTRIGALTIDCQVDDLGPATEFWSKALGRAVENPDQDGDGKYSELKTDAGEPFLLLQKVSHPSRVHFDIESDDIDAEVARLEKLGATVFKQLERWVVMQAPTGQRFCVVRVQRPGFPKNANRWD